MNITVHSSPGMEFYLTDKGAQIGRIRVKFNGAKYHAGYRHTVPKAWIDNGWVAERKEN